MSMESENRSCKNGDWGGGFVCVFFSGFDVRNETVSGRGLRHVIGK